MKTSTCQSCKPAVKDVGGEFVPACVSLLLAIPVCSIQALLSAPNPDDPLAENVAKHWKDNEKEAILTGERGRKGRIGGGKE